MGEHNAELPVPVQQIVNTRRRWQAWAAGGGPPYEVLLTTGLGDVTSLARYAVGHVQGAFEAGLDMQLAKERAQALMLHGLDLLDAVVQEHAVADDAPAEVRGAAEVALARALPDVVAQALDYRAYALAEMAQATAATAVALAAVDDVATRAATYEQGAMGVPPQPPLLVQPTTGLRT